MKKIFTLATAVLMTVAVMAADRRPSVTLQGGKNYEVFIDGKAIAMKQFGAMELNFLRSGKHTITVYEIPRRFFAIRSKRVVSSSTFLLRGNDIAIKINQDGQIKIKEDVKKGFDRDWNDHDNGYGYGKDNGNGKGNGYGKDRDDKPGRF